MEEVVSRSFRDNAIVRTDCVNDSVVAVGKDIFHFFNGAVEEVAVFYADFFREPVAERDIRKAEGVNVPTLFKEFEGGIEAQKARSAEYKHFFLFAHNYEPP